MMTILAVFGALIGLAAAAAAVWFAWMLRSAATALKETAAGSEASSSSDLALSAAPERTDAGKEIAAASAKEAAPADSKTSKAVAPAAAEVSAAAMNMEEPVPGGTTGEKYEHPDDSPSKLALPGAWKRTAAASHLFKWTFFDYMLLVLFLIGSLFLFTDLLAVRRDIDQFPPYHYGYLLCGFIFTFAGALMMLIRLGVTLAISRSNAAPGDEQ